MKNKSNNKQGQITSFFRTSRADQAPASSATAKKRPRPTEGVPSSQKEVSPERKRPASTSSVNKMKRTELDDNRKPSIPDREKTISTETCEKRIDPNEKKTCSSLGARVSNSGTTMKQVSKTTAKNKVSPTLYKVIAEAFHQVEQLTGRLEIQYILAELFRSIISSNSDDLLPAIYLCANKLAPSHHGIELGIGESILMKALSQVTGRTVAALKSTYKQVGDLGDVAANARTTQKTMFTPPPLTVKKVYSELLAIAKISGKNTQEVKQAKIVKLLVAASKIEAKYISRALLGKLRIHLADKTVIAALAAAVTLEGADAPSDILMAADGKKKQKLTGGEEALENEIKEAVIALNAVYSQLPVWETIIPHVLEFKVVDDRLRKACGLTPGVPVSPMLAKPTKAISEVIERFTDVSFTCEYKYDGERAQIHRLKNGTVKIYSRNAEDLTPKYPDLITAIPTFLKEEHKNSSFIIDSEVVAYDTVKGRVLPFQELQGRKRKDVKVEDVTVKVCIFAFDLLLFDEENMIEEAFQSRRDRLRGSFKHCEGTFHFAKGNDSSEPDNIAVLLDESIKDGCEGLMVKALAGEASTYEPANRSQNWLKVKKDYLEGCGDSLDLVPIGGYIGKGKRTGTYGAFLLACFDPDTEEYQSICKIGTGFTESQLDEFGKFYNDTEMERKTTTKKAYYRTPSNDQLNPDVWFEPLQVWEVKCADLSISPQHMAAVGLVDPDKGIALRFPRFIRLRDDKKTDEATSAEQVAEFYTRQHAVSCD